MLPLLADCLGRRARPVILAALAGMALLAVTVLVWDAWRK